MQGNILLENPNAAALPTERYLQPGDVIAIEGIRNQRIRREELVLGFDQKTGEMVSVYLGPDVQWPAEFADPYAVIGELSTRSLARYGTTMAGGPSYERTRYSKHSYPRFSPTFMTVDQAQRTITLFESAERRMATGNVSPKPLAIEERVLFGLARAALAIEEDWQSYCDAADYWP